jgi:hypothetical protein
MAKPGHKSEMPHASGGLKKKELEGIPRVVGF